MTERVTPLEETSGGLRRPPPQHAFDPLPLTAWMQQHVEGFAAPIDVLQFAGGQSNPTFLIETPTQLFAGPKPNAALWLDQDQSAGLWISAWAFALSP